MRISGNHNDVDHWRRKFKTCPTVMLDGQKVEHVIEAAMLPDEGCSWVTVGLQGGDKPMICNVVAPDGIVVDQIFGTKTLRGKVEIIGDPI